METKEIIAGEYIFRGESLAENKPKTIKKHTGRLAGVIAAFIVLAAGTVTVFATENKKKPVETPVTPAPVQKTEEKSSGTVVPKHPVSRLYKMLTPTDYEELYLTIPKPAQDDAISVADESDADSSAIPVDTETEELIGILSYSEDILALYRAREPGLPSYLTCEMNPKYHIDLTEQELSDLMTLVEAEAPSEDIYGKILVANVVLNRYLAGWGKTVHDVMFAKNQFTPTQKKWYWNSIVVTDSTREAVTRALKGEDYSKGALYFFAWENHLNLLRGKGWRSKLQYLFVHDGHAFYK